MIANTRSTSTLLLTHRVLCCVSFFSLWTKQKKKKRQKKKIPVFFFSFSGFFSVYYSPLRCSTSPPCFWTRQENVNAVNPTVRDLDEIRGKMEWRFSSALSKKVFFFKETHTHTSNERVSPYDVCVFLYEMRLNVNHVVFILCLERAALLTSAAYQRFLISLWHYYITRR